MKNSEYDPVYLDTRKQYIESMYDQRDKLDTYSLTFSAGVFGVSFAFITQIVGDLNQCESIWILIVSWVFFASNIIIILISFRKSENDFDRMIKELDDGEKDSQGSKSIDWLNTISITFIIIGIILLLTFTSINTGVFKWEKKEEKKEHVSLLQIQNHQGTIQSPSLDEKE